jgi:hypothetical protein
MVTQGARQSIPMIEFDTGIDDCLDDFLNANAPESPAVEEETNGETMGEDPEENMKQYYDTLFVTQKPLHEHTEVTQLDAIARLMAFKSDRHLNRDGFNDLLVVIGSLLPKGHLLTKSMYESNKILRSLKI